MGCVVGGSSIATSSSWTVGGGPGAGRGVLGSGARAARAPERISLSSEGYVVESADDQPAALQRPPTWDTCVGWVQ
eukprot:3325020-Pleurochrysis_carterae.AAC.1